MKQQFWVSDNRVWLVRRRPFRLGKLVATWGPDVGENEKDEIVALLNETVTPKRAREEDEARA